MTSKKKKSKKEAKQDPATLTDVKEAQPLDDGASNAPPPQPAEGQEGAEAQPPPESEKKSAKGKKKKLSAKERKRLKAEQAERERLAALQEEQNRLAEKRREEERRMEKLGRERLMTEEQELTTFRQNKVASAKMIRSEAAKVAEWDRYLKCDHSTNPQDRADVNSFISIWKEAEDIDIKVLFEHIGLAANLANQIRDLCQVSEVSQNNEELALYSKLVSDIQQLIRQKIEALTMHHLMYSDKYFTPTAATTTAYELLNDSSNGYQYSIWINLAKNPRIKDIIFTNVSIEGVCKVIAMYSLAIRITHYPDVSEAGNYALLSSVMACEFLQLPAAPKKITTYTLRQSNVQNLQVLPYPLKSNSKEAQTPLVFKMKIDTERLPENLDLVTVIKIDDLEHTKELISDVQLDQENSTVQFTCTTTGVFALAVPKYCHFPFQFWEINSPVAETVEIYIRTAFTEITMTIDKKGLCSMDSPLSFTGLTAPAALELLQRHGINLIAPDNIADINDDRIHEKPPSLEEVFNSGIADTATGFRIRCSVKNSRITRAEHEDPRIMLLAREIGTFGEPITDDEAVEEEEEQPEAAPPPEEAQQQQTDDAQQDPPKKERVSRWRCVQGTEKHIYEVRNTENEEETEMTMLKGTNFHQHMMPMLMDLASDEVKERVMNSSAFIRETVMYLISKMRLFSVTI